MVFNVLLPCLLFTDMALSINFSQMFSFISVALYAALYPVIGYFLGLIVKFFCKPTEEIERGMIMSICFGNAAFLPLTLIATISTSSVGIFAAPGSMQNAIQYISIYVSAFSLVYWTVAPHYMNRKPNVSNNNNSDTVVVTIDEEDILCDSKQSLQSPILGEFDTKAPTSLEESLLTSSSSSSSSSENHLKSSSSSLHLTSEVEIEIDHNDDNEDGEGDNENMSLVKKLNVRFSNIISVVSVNSKDFLKKFLSPPTIAVIFGLLVGLILPLKHLLFAPPAVANEFHFTPFSFITNAMSMVGAAALPCSMIILGVNLSNGPTRDKITKRTIFAVTTARLFLLPSTFIFIVK